MNDLLLVVAGAVIGAAIVAGVWRARSLRWEYVPAPPPKAVGDPRFEEIVGALDAGIVTVDRRGRIEFVNPSARTIFGIDPERARGRAVIEAVPSIELDRRVGEALRGRSSMSNLVLGPRGRDSDVLVRAYPLRDGSAALVASDQTKLIALERTRREFISDVSHELRTPLSSIKLMIETILESDDAEARRLFLPKVRTEVDRMVKLVEDLLDLARAESGHMRMQSEPFDLAAFTEGQIQTFAQRAQAGGIELVFQGPEPVTFDGDADRIAQVIVNLVDNALRHTPEGGRIVASVTADAGTALLSVRDTGVGIPFSDLSHVFDRFYVVERSRAREAAGTGLGLAIVKQIVEAHGGRVEAESEFGKGATFTCSFPLERQR